MIRIFISLCLVSLFATNAFAQKLKADKFYHAHRYFEAIHAYEDFLKDKKPNQQPQEVRNLADAYFQTRNTQLSYKWYEKLINFQPGDSLALIRLFYLANNNCDADKAQVFLNILKNKSIGCNGSTAEFSGSGCTSNIMLSAPAAILARVIGSTQGRQKVACEGSTAIGK